MHISQVMPSLAFSGTPKKNTQLTFSKLPEEVLDIIEVSKDVDNTEAADNYLLKNIENMLNLFLNADNVDINVDNTDSDRVVWNNVLYQRSRILVEMIQQVPTIEIMDKVVDLFNNNNEFVFDAEKSTHVSIVNALVQQVSRLSTPSYLRDTLNIEGFD